MVCPEYRYAQASHVLRYHVLKDSESARSLARDEHPLSLSEKVAYEVRNRVRFASSRGSLHDETISCGKPFENGPLLRV